MQYILPKLLEKCTSMKKPTLTTKLKSLFDPYLWTGSDLLTILVLFQFDRGVGQAHLKGCIPPLGRQPQAFEQTLKIDRKERPSKTFSAIHRIKFSGNDVHSVRTRPNSLSIIFLFYIYYLFSLLTFVV